MPLSKRFFADLAGVDDDMPRAKKAKPAKRASAGVKAMRKAANMAVKRLLAKLLK